MSWKLVAEVARDGDGAVKEYVAACGIVKEGLFLGCISSRSGRNRSSFCKKDRNQGFSRVITDAGGLSHRGYRDADGREGRQLGDRCEAGWD